jgi:hypothetical protein
MWQVQANQMLKLGAHAAPVQAVFDLSGGAAPVPSVASTSWDATVKFWSGEGGEEQEAAGRGKRDQKRSGRMDH